MTDIETADLLKTIPLFSALGRRDRLALAKTARLRRPEAFTKLVTQGTAARSCFLLLEGEVEVLRNAERIGTLTRGEVFGELSLIDGGDRSADVVMLTRGEVLEVGGEGFEQLLETSPAASRAVLEQLCSRLRALDDAAFG